MPTKRKNRKTKSTRVSDLPPKKAKQAGVRGGLMIGGGGLAARRTHASPCTYTKTSTCPYPVAAG